MKKPLPVKIVEILGCAYVALAVLMFIMFIRNVIGVAGVWINSLDGILICLCSIVPVLLTAGMLVSLRRRRRGWFAVPNTVLLMLLVAGLVSDMLDHSATELVVASVAASLLVIVPLILLYLPSSTMWFTEKTEAAAGASGCLPCMVGCATTLMALGLLVVMCSPARGRGMVHQISKQGRELFWCMAQNKTARESGEEWIDPSSCTNSTQFVQMLGEKYGRDLRYTNIWCIAVNPVADDGFPLIFTCNVDPRELLRPQDEDRPVRLTCPKAHCGTCFRFCEKAVVIVSAGGDARIVKKQCSSSNRIFTNGIPKPGPDTCFLTPTGRVDFADHLRL